MVGGWATGVVVAAAAVGAGLGAAPGAQAAASHQNGQISWVDNSAWVAANPDGSGQHTITLSGAGVPANPVAVGVSFSPDGKSVAVLIAGQYGDDIFIANPDGTNARKIASVNLQDSSVAWAPDGSAVYYTALVPSTGPNNMGGNVEQVIVAKTDGSGATALPGQDPTMLNSQPTVSSSGQIAYLTQTSTDVYGHLRVLDPGSATPRTLPVQGSFISYSPDGSRIAVLRADNNGGGLVATI
jgi:Tol biopolymer transport system component